MPEQTGTIDFETSESTDKLDDALAKAQGEFGMAPKAKLNPHFGTRYADLAGVVAACAPALSKHGISRSQWPVHGEDGRLHIVTRLAHAGQWIKAHFSMPVPKQDPQGYGSAITYAKRFCLAAACGVVADDEDDDGAGAGDGDGKDKMPAKQLADFLAEIESVEDVDRLKDVYLKAEKACGKDRVAMARVASAKTARYKAIVSRQRAAAAAGAQK